MRIEYYYSHVVSATHGGTRAMHSKGTWDEVLDSDSPFRVRRAGMFPIGDLLRSEDLVKLAQVRARSEKR